MFCADFRLSAHLFSDFSCDFPWPEAGNDDFLIHFFIAQALNGI